MFLDSDLVFDKMAFNENNTNLWDGSAVKAWMNRTESGEFLQKLTEVEKTRLLHLQGVMKRS